MSRKENLSQSTHTANSWRPPRRLSQPSSTRSRRSTSSTATMPLLFLQRKNSCLRRCCLRKARTTLPGQARRLRNSPPLMASLLRVLVLVRTASGLSLMLRRPWPNLQRIRCWCPPTHSILQTRRDSPLSARRVRARTVASSSRTSRPGLMTRMTRKTLTSLLAPFRRHTTLASRTRTLLPFTVLARTAASSLRTSRSTSPSLRIPTTTRTRIRRDIHDKKLKNP